MLFTIPFLILFAVAALVAGLMLWAKRYIKVSPDRVAVITGRKRKLPDGKVVGYRIVRGGATFVWPIRETIQYMSLKLMPIPVEVQKAYNKDNVPVSVEGLANIKISGEDEAIANAVERFLEDPRQIEPTVKSTLDGHLRTIVGTMTIEALNSDRKTFQQRVTEEAAVDLGRMGLTIDSFVIKSLKDEHGYLDALGIKRTAEVKRDADIGRAQAEAEAKKKTSEAAREAAEIATENERKIAEATKKLEVQKAFYSAEVNKEQATAEQAGPRAKAEAEKGVLVAQQEAKAAEARAAADFQLEESSRRANELTATVVKQAGAEKEAAILKAEGVKQARITIAEGEKTAAELEAQGSAARIVQEGRARATATQATLEAEAAGIKAKLISEADGKKELAEAFKRLNDAGQLLLLMEKSPDVIKAFGEAGGEIAKNIFASLAAPLGSIDSLTVYDTGGENGDGSAVKRVANIVPGMFFDFLTKAKANGVPELGELLSKTLAYVNASLSTSKNSDENKEKVAVQ